ncbi:hypothetical protein B0H17DRAFT_365558 [Mycena rosella]|uniref:Uncharacterized protein n=1 Tax=Mycena rosella TaxID=1033263 RepID=A0AAD7GZJ0_MYCRO|nr:hypothetical protein B0H17DRAFT_365558 [Mycena rosella]
MPAAVQSVVLFSQPTSIPDVPMPGPAPETTISAPGVSEGSVDVGSFKPTFIPCEGKAKKDSDYGNDKERKEKVLVSFQEDEEDGPLQISPSKDQPKKKRRKDKQLDEEASMWVEKPAPDVVKAFPVPPPSTRHYQKVAATSPFDNPFT